MEKIKAIVCGLGFSALVLILFFGVSSSAKVKGATSFWCLERVVLNDNGTMSDQFATQTDLNQFFQANNLVVYPEDKVALSLPLNLCKGSLITIDRAPVVNLKIGKNNSVVRSWAATVADLLKEQNIVMGAQDKIEPSLQTKISTGMNITLTHWGTRLEKKDEAIAYNVEKQADSDLVVGNTQVSRAGINGEKEVTYKITSVNGDDVASAEVSEQITIPPTNEILLYGTKPPTTYLGTGNATWYIQTDQMIGACNLASMGDKLLVTNLNNGVSIQVTDSGGGAFSSSTVIDLSTTAFNALDSGTDGIIPNVKVELINQ